MNGSHNPPTDIPASELLLRLLARPQPSEVIDFPARSTNGASLGQIRVMVLRMEQHDEARLKAREFLRTKRKMTDADLSMPLGESLLGDATARELIAMAVCHVAPIPGTEESPIYPVLFRTAIDVNKLTADEVTALFGAYLLVQKRYGPNERDLDDAEVNAWIQRLEEGGAAYPLGSLPLHRHAELTWLLARRASFLSKLLSSPPESWQRSLESAPETWASTTFSSTEQPAGDSPSDSDEPISPEQAMAAAKSFIGRE